MIEKLKAVAADHLLIHSTFAREEQVRLLYMQAPLSNGAIILISLLYYFLLQPLFQSDQLLVWMLSLIALSLYRLSLWYWRYTRPEIMSATSWLRSYLVGCGLMGMVWSLIYPFLMGFSDPFVLTALLMLAFGVMSSAIPILSVYMPAFILNTYPQGITLIVIFLSIEDDAYSWLALAVAVFMLMITLFTRNTNRSIRRAINFQEQNRSLIGDLNKEINQRELLIAKRTLELERKNSDLIGEMKVRKNAEDKLRQANADLDATLRAIPDLMFEMDGDGTYINIWTEDTGLLVAPKHTLLGRTVADMLPEDAASVIMEAIQEALETGTSRGQVIKIPLEDGDRWFELSASRKLTENSHHVLLLERDITDKRRIEKELLQSQKMQSIGTLAGGIAHDFNNILSSIIGFTELALEDAPKGSSLENNLREVDIAGARARELVKQILAFARQSTDEKEPLVLSDIVAEALKLLRPLAPTTIGITLTTSNSSTIMGNSSQLHQIVMNLCTNSIHSLQESGGLLEIELKNVFLERGKEFSVTRLPEGEYVELTVTDNGKGIEPSVIKHIFEPYFTTKEVGEGTGMGLAMVKGIVESYGGDIHVYSKPGIKTVFTIRLPAVEINGEEITDQAEPLGPETGTESILFVDDEAAIIRMGTSMFESLGYSVTARTNSCEALEIFKERPDAFDLVITDMTMPDMTGDSLSIELRKIRKDIPIILCTGYSRKMDEAKASILGINAFASKPFTMSEISKTIREVLDSSKPMVF